MSRARESIDGSRVAAAEILPGKLRLNHRENKTFLWTELQQRARLGGIVHPT